MPEHGLQRVISNTTSIQLRMKQRPLCHQTENIFFLRVSELPSLFQPATLSLMTKSRRGCMPRSTGMEIFTSFPVRRWNSEKREAAGDAEGGYGAQRVFACDPRISGPHAFAGDRGYFATRNDRRRNDLNPG